MDFSGAGMGGENQQRRVAAHRLTRSAIGSFHGAKDTPDPLAPSLADARKPGPFAWMQAFPRVRAGCALSLQPVPFRFFHDLLIRARRTSISALCASVNAR
jgi:hypothetical protein